MASSLKIKIELNRTDKLFEILGYLALALIWLLTIYSYYYLLETIPNHFDINGNIEAYGSKTSIFIVPFISTFLFVGLTILNRFPQIFNYPTEITDQNRSIQYSNATRLIRLIKLSITLIFLITGLIPTQTIWISIVIIFGIHIPLVYYIYKMFKNR